MKGRGQERPTQEGQAMADPVYNRIDLVTLTAAVVLAAGVVFLLAQIMPPLADLMMLPPP